MPLLLFLFLAKQKNWKDVRAILLYCLYSLINDKLLLYFENQPDSGKTSFFLLSLFTAVEYSFFSYIIYSFLRNPTFKKIILICYPIFLAFVIILFLRAGSNHMDSVSITVEYIAIIIFTLFFFFEEISEPNTTFIYSTSQFWAIAGILIYSAGTFFLFLYSDSISDEEWDKFSIINFVFTIIKNVCFSIAVTIKPDPENLNTNEIQTPNFHETPLNPINTNP